MLAVLAALGCVSRPCVPCAGSDAAAYRWLLNQQAESGLLGNQEDDPITGVYANALAAICYIHQGDRVRAERIFDVFAAQADEAFRAPGGFHQLWDVHAATPHRDSDRWVGDKAAGCAAACAESPRQAPSGRVSSSMRSLQRTASAPPRSTP